MRDTVSAVGGESATLSDRLVEGVNNLLVLAPPMAPCAADACADLLSADSQSARDVLYVSFVDTPDRRVDEWRRRFGPERPAKMGFVTVGESTRSASATVAGDGSEGAVTVRTVSSPGNLTDLGIQVSRYLAEWDGDGRRTEICFDSLTTPLQYADVPRVFRFLHVLTGRIRSTDGFAHFHVDPGSHEPRTLNTLKTVFDGVAEWDGEGWTVRNR